MERKFVMDELSKSFLDEVADELAASKEGRIIKPINLLDGTEAKIAIHEVFKGGDRSLLSHIIKGEFLTGVFEGENFTIECGDNGCLIVISPKNY